MSNMSYCRYENTSADMQDCLDAIRYDGLTDLSGSERKCAHELYEAAMKYIVEYEANSHIIARWVETPDGRRILTTYDKEDKQ
jgi:hypothetical protein